MRELGDDLEAIDVQSQLVEVWPTRTPKKVCVDWATLHA